MKMKREKKTNSRRRQKDAKKYLEAHVHKRPRSLPRVGFSWRLEVVDWEQDGKTPNEGETECDSLEPEPEIGTRCRHLHRAVAEASTFLCSSSVSASASSSSSSSSSTVASFSLRSSQSSY